MNYVKKITLLNALIPILAGAVIYYLFSPETVFVKLIDSTCDIEYHCSIAKEYNVAYSFIRNYLLDMLWAYALTFSLFYVFGNNAAHTKDILLIACLFSIIMELVQAIPCVNGTFDMIDVLLEICSVGVAVIVINKIA